MERTKHIFLGLVLFVFLVLPVSSLAAEAVVLQLKWTHAFQFAGYYAALEKGFYHQAGLDVEIKPAGPGIDPVEIVTKGKADFGVGTSSLLLSRHQGLPVNVLAVIFQHSPQVIISRHEITMNDLNNLTGKSIMIEPQADELFAFLEKENIDKTELNIIPHSFAPADLINGSVDAMSAYSTYETWFLDKAGLNYDIFTPRSAGVDFYGDNLFTTERLIRENPERVQKFLKASLDGWNYALTNTEEIIQLISEKYSDGLPASFYRYEAARMKELIQSQLVEVGYMSKDRWQHIADTYAELNLLPEDFALDDFIFAIDYQAKIDQANRYFISALVILLIVTSIAYYIHVINQKLRKITARQKVVEKELRANETRLRFLFETTPAAILVWKAGGIITGWNQQSVKLFGWQRDEVIDRSFLDFLMPENLKQEWSIGVEKLLEKNDLPESINENLTKDGQTITCQWLNSWMPESPGKPREMISLAIDVSERKKLEEEVKRLAFYDPLTNLANRRLLLDRLDHSLASSKRKQYYGALLFLDLDNLKPINDEHGHEVGDLLLIEAASRLKSSMRQSDTVSRYGGDEFVMVIDNAGQGREEAIQEAVAIAEKARITLSEAYKVTSEKAKRWFSIYTTVSIGLTVFNGEADKKETIISLADSAMYEAKKTGKNKICSRFFDEKTSTFVNDDESAGM